MSTHSIAIVGGGFSGTVLAVNLLRGHSGGALRVVLIERGAQVGRGIAYAQAPYPYLLNVPASRMSASPADPGEFFDFARSRRAECTIDDFLPRSLYGEYLMGLLHQVQAEAAADFQIIRGAVVGMTGGGGHPFELNLQGAPAIHADRVVLCIGAPPAASVCALELSTQARDRVCRAYDPLIDFTDDRDILLLGSGLTMADMAIAADAQNSKIVVHVLSRHGLLPKAQTVGPAVTVSLFDIDALPDTSLRTIVRLSRNLAEEAAQRGGDWRDVVVALRGVAARLWARWSETDRRRFLRHLRAFWDIHRHRLPPQTMAHLQRLRDEWRLHVYAGQIRGLHGDGTRIRADWISRPAAEPLTARFDRVVNCTGSSCSLEHWNDPLARTLRSKGLISADALGLGLRTGRQGAVIAADGTQTDGLYYLGPMLRADHWEATATSELRHHAENLARHLLR